MSKDVGKSFDSNTQHSNSLNKRDPDHDRSGHVHWAKDTTTPRISIDPGIVINSQDGLNSRPAFFLADDTSDEDDIHDGEEDNIDIGSKSPSFHQDNSTLVSPSDLEKGKPIDLESPTQVNDKDSNGDIDISNIPRDYSKEAAKILKNHRHRLLWQRMTKSKKFSPNMEDIQSASKSSISSGSSIPPLRIMSAPSLAGMSNQLRNGIESKKITPSHSPANSLSPPPSRVNSSQSLTKLANSFTDVKQTISQASQKLTQLPVVPHFEGLTHNNRRSSHALSALMATTANLTGIASVHGSTVAPAPNRPGYKLSRYSMPDVTETQVIREEEEEIKNEKEQEIKNEKEQKNISNLCPPLNKRKSGFWTPSLFHSPSSGTSTPKEKKEWTLKNRKRRAQEIYITMHLASILQRQDFILRLGRSLMAFGAPTHRIESQLQFTGRILELDCQAIYLPGVLVITFGNQDTHTSQTLFIKQASTLDLYKLNRVHRVYEDVIKDRIGSGEGITELDKIMRSNPIYKFWQVVLIGGLCSVFITPLSFGGNFIDSVLTLPLGGLLVAIQSTIAQRNALYSNVFEISVAMLISFIARALARTGKICYSAITSGSLVLILPGYTVLCGSLELSSKNFVSGSVRLIFAVIYSLFLGFGISIGSNIYSLFDSSNVGLETTCNHIQSLNAPWYLQTPNPKISALWVIGFSYFLSLRNGAIWRSPRTLIMVIFASIAWTANHFVSVKLPNRADITSAIGAFVVGFLGNIWSRTPYASNDAFTTIVTGVLFQVPSGLGAGGGLLNFATANTNSNSTITFQSGFEVGLSLIEVAIGLTVGLFAAVTLLHPFDKRTGGLFSF